MEKTQEQKKIHGQILPLFERRVNNNAPGTFL